MQHEGYVAREMEERGLVSERCTENREIRRINGFTETIKKLAKDLLHKLIGEARDILERKGRYTAHSGNEVAIRRDDASDRRTGNGDSRTERRTSEIKTEKDTSSAEIGIDLIADQINSIRRRFLSVKKSRKEKQELDMMIVPSEPLKKLPSKIMVDYEGMSEKTGQKSLESQQDSRLYRYHFLFNKALREHQETINYDIPDRSLGRSR